MAAKIHGVLGSAALATNAPTTIYTVPAGRKATISLNLANAEPAAAEVSVSVGGAVIETQTSIASKGVLERTGITLSAGQAVSVTRATAPGAVVHAAVWGIEEDV